MEKKLRIFDLSSVKPTEAGEVAAETIPASAGFEIGQNVHTASIKFIVWTRDPNILITASENTLRWFDLRTRKVVKQEVLDGEIGSCELCGLAPEVISRADLGEGLPLLAVAAGKCVYFWGGMDATNELKRLILDYQVASVAVDPKGRKIVVGEDKPATWARVYRWDDDVEIGGFAKTYASRSHILTADRCPQRPPWTCMVSRILPGRQPLCHGLGGWNHQDVEELRGLLRALAGWSGWKRS